MAAEIREITDSNQEGCHDHHVADLHEEVRILRRLELVLDKHGWLLESPVMGFAGRKVKRNA